MLRKCRQHTVLPPDMLPSHTKNWITHKSQCLIRFLFQIPLYCKKRSMSPIPSHPSLLIIPEPPQLSETQSALAAVKSLCGIKLKKKHSSYFQTLWHTVTRGSTFLCGVTGPCRYANIDFKDIWWRALWGKKMKVLRQAGLEWEWGLFWRGTSQEPLERPSLQVLGPLIFALSSLS